MVDVQERDLPLVLLEHHDGRVGELVHFRQVVDPQHAREPVARGAELGRPGVLDHVAPRRELLRPAKVGVRLRERLDDHVERERKHDGVVDDGEGLDVEGLAVLHEALAAEDAADVFRLIFFFEFLISKRGREREGFE